MTTATMALAELTEKGADIDVLRQMVQLNRRYMQLEGLQTVSDTAPTRLSAVAR